MAVLATKIQANNHVFLINHTYIVLASMRFMSLLSIIKCPVKQLGSLYHGLPLCHGCFEIFLEDSVSCLKVGIYLLLLSVKDLEGSRLKMNVFARKIIHICKHHFSLSMFFFWIEGVDNFC